MQVRNIYMILLSIAMITLFGACDKNSTGLDAERFQLNETVSIDYIVNRETLESWGQDRDVRIYHALKYQDKTAEISWLFHALVNGHIDTLSFSQLMGIHSEGKLDFGQLPKNATPRTQPEYLFYLLKHTLTAANGTPMTNEGIAEIAKIFPDYSRLKNIRTKLTAWFDIHDNRGTFLFTFWSPGCCDDDDNQAINGQFTSNGFIVNCHDGCN